ncbi:TadE family type IV pilus minor pilin [Streptomyces sp. TR02-1]|uniref:TadE family type IV pilus minor pilin n=1 Tax=Streptomyces sp. TR02-1 TaxID=3385977 RepID=UPI0039A1D111
MCPSEARAALRAPGGRADGADGGDAGYVTAETAVVVPSLVLLAAMMLWGLTAAAGLVQCVDGAGAGARAAARGESGPAVRRLARSVAPEGARIDVSRAGELVRVHVSARARGPGPLAIPLEAEAVALAEDTYARDGAGTGPAADAGRAR